VVDSFLEHTFVVKTFAEPAGPAEAASRQRRQSPVAAVITDIPSRWAADAHRDQPRHLTVLPPPRQRGARQAVYRRRQAIALVVLFLVAWVALEALAGVLGVSGDPVPASTSPQPSSVEVRPGDTYWTIASRLQPQGDPRPLVDRLVASHGGGGLQAGERLVVPQD